MIKKQTLVIPGPAGAQELLLSSTATARPITCVICHPHPLYEGTMHNKVVYSLAAAFATLQIKTVRFNFRGVQGSAGQFDHGRGEQEDALNIVRWITAQHPEEEVWCAGFSFGAFVALNISARCQAKKLITIAPPVGQPYFVPEPIITCPWLLVQGGQDEIIAAHEVIAWAEQRPQVPEIVCMPEAGHFFHGQLHVLQAHIVDFCHA